MKPTQPIIRRGLRGGFINPGFCHFIPGIAQAYGDLGFWIQNLTPEANPDATWRALMVVGSLKIDGFNQPIRGLLAHEDSRVRAWACFALGQLKDEAAVDQIHDMNADPSIRVRFHAWQAIQSIIGPNGNSRCYPLRVPPKESPILISEDSRKIQCVLTSLFRELGFSVETASTEEETIDKALRLKPQVVITDNQKGKDNLSGLNLTREFSKRSELRETVLFMLTGDFIEPIFLWSGGDYFLSKNNCGLKDIGEAVTSYLRY
jgi:CheY-like chemotaxis protein